MLEGTWGGDLGVLQGTHPLAQALLLPQQLQEPAAPKQLLGAQLGAEEADIGLQRLQPLQHGLAGITAPWHCSSAPTSAPRHPPCTREPTCLPRLQRSSGVPVLILLLTPLAAAFQPQPQHRTELKATMDSKD